jgi:glutathione peroxidase
MQTIDGEEAPLSEYAGKVLVVVNVASRCGNTPQYGDLQAFYEAHQEQGLEILGFPANNFMGQEPGTNEEIKAFCTREYAVSFPMFAKISVKGKDQHPLYTWLEAQTGQKPKWNFHKYLINRQGEVVMSIKPGQKVSDPDIQAAILAELAKS